MVTEMRIVVDGFGGDNAPLAVLQGCEMAVKEYGVEIIVTGDEEILKKTAEENNVSLEKITFCHAPDVISMEDDPFSIMKEKSECSMAKAFNLLKEGEGDAFVSAGRTGAIVIGANFIVKRIKGIKRAALATVVPTISSVTLVEATTGLASQFGVYVQNQSNAYVIRY